MANASLWLYRMLLHGALPALLPTIWVRDRLTGKQRPPVVQRLARRLPPCPAGCLWIQAVSVGEVELARRLAGELQRQAPELPLLLTTTTATGLALARRTLAEQALVHPCPFDLPRPVSRVLDTARPRALVLVETELWPELLYQAGRRGIPVVVVNGRLSDGSFARYRRVRRSLVPLLAPLSLVLARSQTDAESFAAIGVAEERIRVSGNIKYDLQPDPQPLPWQEAALAAASNRPIVVAGSTMEGEERQVLEALGHLERGPGVFLILAPRHPERFDAVASLLAQHGAPFLRRSTLQPGDEPGAQPGSTHGDILLLDTIGELGRAYQLATAAFIGGSLVATGGHNPLEPAVWGVPVLSGPHVHNFREVYDELVQEGGACIVGSPQQLAASLDAWLGNRDAARRAGAAGCGVVERNRGATSRTVGQLLEVAGVPTGVSAAATS